MATTRTREALVAFVIAACLVEPALGAVGKTQGIAGVSDSGSSQYTIPIWTSPDTGGMQPRLALTYDHRSTNTLLGIGWNISGLSEITRCSRTWAQDLQVRNVRNDSQDRFCLDGMKLRLLTGTYGANNAEYRTEIESFSRIKSYDASPTIGPGYFVVERNDGLKYEYGGTTDSRIESVGQNVARAWALNKISDRYGNATLFTYAEDTTNGAYRISSIQYTSNIDLSLSPSHVVSFIYDGKPAGEIDSVYLANSQIRELNRLSRIDVLAGTTLLRRYQLTYEVALSGAGRSRLQSLQECAGPSGSLDCLPATTFTYQAGGVGLGTQTSTAATVPSDQNPFAIDVNGDGRDDLIYASGANCTGTWMVMMATTAGGFGSPTPTGGASAAGCFGAIPIDYNADGKVDLLVPVNGTTWSYMLGGASGLAGPVDTGIPAPGVGPNAAAVDLNGDGLEDLVWMDLFAVAIRYRLREAAGSFSSTVTDLWGPMGSGWMLNSNLVQPTGQYSRRRLPDFNGDGKGDVAFANSFSWFDPESQQTFVDSFWEFHFTGGGGTSMPSGPTMQFPRFLDANGDGKDDLLYISGSSLVLVFGTGTSFTSGASLGSASGFNVNQLVVLDSDGDGRDDFMLPHSSGTWYLFRSTGIGATSSNTGIPVSSGWINATAGDFNGDGLTDVGYSSGGTWVYRMHQGPYPDLLASATDGFGNACTFTYAPLTAASYTKLATAVFPQQDYNGSLYVVTNYNESNGIGGTYDLTSFYYEGARRDLQGRGLLGFSHRSWIDSRDGTAQRRNYRQDFPFIGFMTNARRTQDPSATVITEMQATPAAHSYGSSTEARSLPYMSQVTRTEREVGGSYIGNLIRTTVQNNSVDYDTGVTYDTTVTVTEPASGSANGIQPNASYTQRTYQPTASFLNDWAHWCFGRPQEVQQINSHNQFGGGSTTRTSSITWDGDKCRPRQTKAEPGHPQLELTRDLDYDNFGNLNFDRTTGIGVSDERKTTAEWDTSGRFPLSVSQRMSPTLSHTSHFEWDSDKGLLTRSRDLNDIATDYGYDAFGRLIREDRPDGTSVTRTFNSCPAPGRCGDPTLTLRYYVETRLLKTAGTVLVRNDLQYFDMLDRPRFDDPLLVTGARADTAIEYDAFGRVAKQSAPRFAAGALFWTEFQYDLLNRVKQVSRPTSDSNASLQTTYSYYEGLTTRVVDPLSKQTTKVANVTGAMARSIDHDGYYQNFDYDAFGNVVRVMDSLSNTLQTNTFNIRGTRTTLTDMAAGSQIFIPNALGEIVSQTTAENQTTTFVYDALGRMTSRTEPEGTSSFTFGASAAAKNIGRLAGMSGPGYSEGYTYDGIGRLQQRSITSDATYYFDYTYNDEGALETLTYPQSTSTYRLKLKYEYQSGQLLRVKDANAPTTVFWQVNSADPWGHIVDETLGNGVQTIRGFDLVTGLLDYIQSGPGGSIQNLNYEWDAVGNLIKRQDTRLPPNLTENFFYDNLHRLTSATGPDAFGIVYDPRGNISSRTGNVSPSTTRTISWYSYNLPNTISSGNQSSQFFYAPDRSRWKQVASYAGTAEETIYVGGMMEKAKLGIVTSWKHYIAGASGPVAIHTRKDDGTNELHYLTRDHLGSVDSITNASGVVRLSFGAFGQRRDGADWNGNPIQGDWEGITATSRRGFTFHETLDNLNLTHMNGRVYDQVIGQFLSPDPFVQAPGFTQSFNRYSYTFNNPLSYTDPSGYSTSDSGTDHFDCLDFCGFTPFGPTWWSSSPEGGGGGATDNGAPANPTPNMPRPADPVEEVVVTASRRAKDGRTCSIGHLADDIGNMIRSAYWNLPNLSISVEVEGTFGTHRENSYSQTSLSVGVNSSGQVFIQFQESSALDGFGDILAGSAGVVGGYSSHPLQTGIEQVNVTSSYGYVGIGANAGSELGSGSREMSVPEQLLPARIGRFAVGAGLAAGQVRGRAKEFTLASDPWLGLIDAPGDYSGCGGRF